MQQLFISGQSESELSESGNDDYSPIVFGAVDSEKKEFARPAIRAKLVFNIISFIFFIRIWRQHFDMNFQWPIFCLSITIF